MASASSLPTARASSHFHRPMSCSFHCLHGYFCRPAFASVDDTVATSRNAISPDLPSHFLPALARAALGFGFSLLAPYHRPSHFRPAKAWCVCLQPARLITLPCPPFARSLGAYLVVSFLSLTHGMLTLPLLLSCPAFTAIHCGTPPSSPPLHLIRRLVSPTYQTSNLLSSLSRHDAMLIMALRVMAQYVINASPPLQSIVALPYRWSTLLTINALSFLSHVVNLIPGQCPSRHEWLATAGQCHVPRRRRRQSSGR